MSDKKSDRYNEAKSSGWTTVALMTRTRQKVKYKKENEEPQKKKREIDVRRKRRKGGICSNKAARTEMVALVVVSPSLTMTRAISPSTKYLAQALTSPEGEGAWPAVWSKRQVL